MKSYNNFIGIDIGKFSFFVASFDSNIVHEFENNDEGIKKFLLKYKKLFKKSLCILEATGGYEMFLLLILCDKEIDVHRANTRHVKNFIRSYGNAAKTDRLDAKALARYGAERFKELKLFTPCSKQFLELYCLSQRRNDLMQMLIAEKNRKQAPRAEWIQTSCDVLIQTLEQQIKEVDIAINDLIASDERIANKKKVLMTIPGIGPIVANEIITMLPEIGTMNRRQIASLSGLAPRANDSGNKKGYRTVAPGRNQVKPKLYLAAMAARNSKSRLADYYYGLISRGKPKKVALVALMRKIIVIANAKVKEIEINYA